MQKYILCILLAVVIAGSAEALVQPDISAIGDFRAFTGNWKDTSGGKTLRSGNLNMAFNELELVVAGYLNPYARGWITVSSPGDGFEIEEAYGTIFNGLPLKSELKLGKYLVDFGKLNTNHVHAYPFIDRPLSLGVLLGPDGFKDEGINWNFLLPTNFYSKVSLNVLKGDIFTDEEPPEDPLEGRYTERPIFSGRCNVFAAVGEMGGLDLGVSGLYGPYKGRGAYGTGEESNGLRNLYATMIGVDAKYKIRWDDYRSMVIQGELIANRRDVFTDKFETKSNFGAYGFIDYRFRKRYNVGVLFDRAPGIVDESEYEQNIPGELSNAPNAAFDTKNSTTALTLFTGFTLLEETTLFRLAGQFKSFHISDSDLLADPAMTGKDSEFTIVLQLIFSMGPHKPHEF